MRLPLEKRLKKRAHIDIAYLQDEAVRLMYGIESGLVLHGGTAIWRCYGGNRFSEGLDFYGKRIDKGRLEKDANSRGLEVEKAKETENLLYAKVSDASATVRVKVNFSKRPGAVAMPYENANGSTTEILALSRLDLLKEKIGAYQNRLLVRDLYDILHLSAGVGADNEAKKMAGKMIADFKKPLDEENLKAVVYSGTVPSVEQMVCAIRGRVL